MPIIKFVNESEKIEYSTEQDVCSLLCYAFDPQKTIMNDNQFVGCKPFGFPFWYMRNPLAVHQFMEFNHKRQFKHWKDLAKHRVISFSKEENSLVATLKIIAERIVSFYANNGYIAAYAIHFGTENPHIHVIVDTISYQNLNKFHMSRRYEWNQIHEILNDYSVQYITRSVSKRVRCENREYSVAVYTRINNVINFYSWCASRLIPRDRTYAKEILNSIGASQSVTDRERAQIALSYHCLSLLDVFWVKEENETVRFEDIDLYTHSLSNALVDIALRGHQMAVTNAHLLANDLSTGGCYPKAWVRKEEGFYLYKAGGQDAVEREVLASKICRCFDCHQVLYEQGMFENEPLSISKIMTSQRYSLVTYAAYDVYCTNHDWNTLDKILELDAHGYYMMNILDYLVGNTDRHWGNWGLLVDNETNRPIRLHDLMDFNRAFQQYDTLDGANCLTVGKRHLSQKEAAMEAVRKIGLNQFVDVAVDIFPEYENWLIKFQVRLHALKANESFR